MTVSIGFAQLVMAIYLVLGIGFLEISVNALKLREDVLSSIPNDSSKLYVSQWPKTI